MSTPTASLSVAEGESCVIIRIVGRANFISSLDFKVLIYGLQEKGRRNFVLYLADCPLMDSTFLGVLAGFVLKFAKAGIGDPKVCVGLYRPSDRVLDLLDNLGVLHLFQVIQDPLPTMDAGAVVPQLPGDHSKKEVTQTCLEAHQVLMEINPANIPKFKEVAKYLAEDLKNAS